MSFRLDERLDRLVVLGAEGDPGDVHVAVGHRHQAEVLLGGLLARHRELGRRAQRRGLGLLAPGVGIDLGVEHENVHIGAGREHVVEPSEADVVCPAVPAHDPHALVDQVVGQGRELPGLGLLEARELPAQLQDALALRRDTGVGGLVGALERGGELAADRGRQAREQQASLRGAAVERETHSQAELGVVLEERVRPRRPAAVAVDRVRSRRQVASVDRAAAGGVGD